MSESPSKLSNFDIFVISLTFFSLVNIVWLFMPLPTSIFRVVLIIDSLCSIAFLTDFFLRLHRAPTKRSYIVDQKGWLDFLGSLPFPLLRLARIFRVAHQYQPFRRNGFRSIWRKIIIDRAGSALLTAVFLTIVVVQYASMSVLWAETGAPDENINTASDAVWWSYQTITTVGYGDKFPVTNWGRFVGVLLMSTGVGLFAVITGFIANWFLAPKKEPEDPATAQQTALTTKLAEMDQLLERLRASTADENQLPVGDAPPRGTPVREEATS
jgi:voltage-gated potassium channel